MPQNLQAKKVLVTGGSGFLGRHVIARLRHVGCAGLSAPPHSDYDLTNEIDVRSMLDRDQPEIVIHCAGHVGGTPAHRRQPATFAYRNLIMGTLLMEQARHFGVEKFVMVGSTASYPHDASIPLQEKEFWNGLPEPTVAAYGLAKRMLAFQLEAYRREYGMAGANVILANLYGPGDHCDPEKCNVLPALVRRFVEAQERGDAAVTVWGTGRATREFLFVEDAAVGIQLAAEHVDDPAPLNLGSGEEVRIADLATLIADAVGFRGKIRFDASQPDGAARRCVDVSRARALLGFEPSVSLHEGIERTVAWFRQNQSHLRHAA